MCVCVWVWVCVSVIGVAWWWEVGVWEDEEFSLGDMRFEAPVEESVPVSSWEYVSGFWGVIWVGDVNGEWSV